MKNLSLKLDEAIFNELESITKDLHIARNRYINEAIEMYNQIQKRNTLKKKLSKESLLVSKTSLNILGEFEAIIDED